MMVSHRKSLGLTLIEVLLVIVIASSLLLFILRFTQQKVIEFRQERAATQMEQISNAAMAYFAAKNTWPEDVSVLLNQGYLVTPTRTTFKNPWGNDYILYATSDKHLFYVYTNVGLNSYARLIKGKLPIAFVSDNAGTTARPITVGSCAADGTGGGANCKFVVAVATMPEQTLDNTNDLTFANLYHSGACVPAPTCPKDANGNAMTPEIMVTPISVSGVNDSCSTTGCATQNAYPLTSFSAYALPAGGPQDLSADGIKLCTSTNKRVCYSDKTAGQPIMTGKYWRVCLRVSTQVGDVDPRAMGGGPDTTWGQSMGTLLVVTRCKPQNENIGSDFTVWTY
jgi:type II secretory pathway pseudopilin PulG